MLHKPTEGTVAILSVAGVTMMMSLKIASGPWMPLGVEIASWFIPLGLAFWAGYNHAKNRPGTQEIQRHEVGDEISCKNKGGSFPM